MVESSPNKGKSKGDGMTTMQIVMKSMEIAMDWTLRLIGPVLVSTFLGIIDFDGEYISA